MKEQIKAAQREAERKHRQDLKGWSSIADKEAERRHIYWLRSEWVGKVRECGLGSDSNELYRLAEIKFPFK